MRFTVICLALLALAAIDLVVAEDQSVPDGSIYGDVYDAETKQPVSGAWVYCQETKCPKQLTDSDGYYAIENCFSPSSDYVIECIKNGYKSAKDTAKTDSSGKAEINFNLGLESQKDNPLSQQPENKSETQTTPRQDPTQVKSWKRTLGGSGNDEGYSVQQTNDDGYIVLGCKKSYGAGKMDIWLVKTDSDGNKLWDKTFGGSGDDEGNSVQQTSDGGYIIAGSQIIKTDSQGNVLWDKHVHGYSLQQTRDGGYIVTSRCSLGPLLIKTDANGNELWNNTFSGGYYVGSLVQQTSDGGYIVTGLTEVGLGVLLLKTDANGNKLWDRAFYVEGKVAKGNSVQMTKDGGYIITGVIASPFSDDTGGWKIGSVWMIKTDSNGYEQWNKTFGGLYIDAEGNSVQQTIDNGYIIIGARRAYYYDKNDPNNSSATRAGNYDVWLIKTDANGNKLWDRVFGGSGGDQGQFIHQTRDGGYILVGDTRSYGAGGSDVWLIKTDSEGN